MTTKDLPRFSIIMPSFNTDEFLVETIDSILEQDYPDIEYIITDGQSTDNTLDILRSYGDRIKWVSEPDDGQSDAINKGFAMATGDLHYWANADDPLEPGALRHVAGLITDFDTPQWVVGAATMINEKGRALSDRVVQEVTDDTFLLWGYKWIPTQSVFWNRKMWEAAGPFDDHLHYVMDLGLWERMHRAAPAIVTQKVLARYRFHSSAKSLVGIEKSRAERKQHLAVLIAADIEKAKEGGAEAMEALTRRYAVLIDELADQAALVERMSKSRYMGPLLKAYSRRVGFFPTFEA